MCVFMSVCVCVYLQFTVKNGYVWVVGFYECCSIFLFFFFFIFLVFLWNYKCFFFKKTSVIFKVLIFNPVLNKHLLITYKAETIIKAWPLYELTGVSNKCQAMLQLLEKKEYTIQWDHKGKFPSNGKVRKGLLEEMTSHLYLSGFCVVVHR